MHQGIHVDVQTDILFKNVYHVRVICHRDFKLGGLEKCFTFVGPVYMEMLLMANSAICVKPTNILTSL